MFFQEAFGVLFDGFLSAFGQLQAPLLDGSLSRFRKAPRLLFGRLPLLLKRPPKLLTDGFQCFSDGFLSACGRPFEGAFGLLSNGCQSTSDGFRLVFGRLSGYFRTASDSTFGRLFLYFRGALPVCFRTACSLLSGASHLLSAGFWSSFGRPSGLLSEGIHSAFERLLVHPPTVAGSTIGQSAIYPLSLKQESTQV